jgi:hypothetical protein
LHVDTCHHFVLIKLEKEHFVRPLGDLLTASSDMVGLMAAAAGGVSMSSSLALHGSFSSLAGLKNSYVDIFEDDGLLVFVLQPTASFSRKKPAHLRTGSSSSSMSTSSSSSAAGGAQTSPIAMSYASSSSIPVGFGMSGESLVTGSMPAAAAARQNKSGSGSTLPSESLPVERVTRLGEGQHSPTHGLPASEVLTIDFKNDEIEFHEELGRGASGATVYACSIKGTAPQATCVCVVCVCVVCVVCV